MSDYFAPSPRTDGYVHCGDVEVSEVISSMCMCTTRNHMVFALCNMLMGAFLK